MTIETIQPLIPEENESSIPWALREIIFSFIAIVLLSLGVGALLFLFADAAKYLIVVYELVYILPVIVVLVLKKAKFETLGLRSFKMEDMAIGCGLLFGTYLIVMLHNLILMSLGVTLQGDYLAEIFEQTNYFALLAFAGIFIAPLVEEIFFRGFVYSGLLEKYGWKKAAVFSSALFALAHMQLAVIIPTFLLGFVFAYLFHRTKSIFPGIILHFLVNSFAFGSLYLLSFFEGFL